MNIQIDDFGCLHSSGGAARIVPKSTIALAMAVTAALVSSLANAGALETRSAQSYGFNDSLWTNNGPERSWHRSGPSVETELQCSVGCGPLFGTFVVRRAELLSSNTADVSVNKVIDLTGHTMGLSGMVVTERLEPDSFSGDPGLPADWVVVGERVLDSNGTHSWALLSNDISLDAHWLPIELYRFEDSSFSMNFEAGAPAGATPEASTWAMMLIGFACLAVAGYGNTKKHQLLRSSCYMSGGSSDT